ncbi:hypothetical protein OG216_09850 [Streptomycetaceae bacterium NBC_01309]
MTCPRAAMAAIDAAVEKWRGMEGRLDLELAPQVVLALHAAGYEISPIGIRQDPVSTDALLVGLRHAGFELQPRRDVPA